MLVHEFTYRLSEQAALEVLGFIRSLPYFSQEQLPDWHLHAQQRPCYHLFYDAGSLVAVATVLETRQWMARIQFGPLAISPEVCNKVIHTLSLHYRQQGFWSLYVQSNETRLHGRSGLEKVASGTFNARSWSTIWVDLSKEDLFASFSKHHQRMIKKAQKLGLDARSLTADDLNAFNLGYCTMYKHRGHTVDPSQQLLMLQNRYQILTQNGLGMLYGAYDGDELIGGIMVAIQGQNWFYVQGFASVDYRHLPVNHYLFHELFIMAKIQGYKYFDMGGYNRFAKESDQIYSINQFKRGFSEDIVDYAPQIEFVFKPFNMFLVSIWQRLKSLL